MNKSIVSEVSLHFVIASSNGRQIVMLKLQRTYGERGFICFVSGPGRSQKHPGLCDVGSDPFERERTSHKFRGLGEVEDGSPTILKKVDHSRKAPRRAGELW